MNDKNTMRDCLTNRRIGNKEVICVENAIDYIKKMGYIVIRPTTPMDYMEATFTFIIFSLILTSVKLGGFVI